MFHFPRSNLLIYQQSILLKYAFHFAVLQQQLAGCLPDGQLTLHRDGYIRPPTYSPPPSARHGVVTSTSIVGILNPEDGYDAPWDVKKNQQQPQPVDVSAGIQND